MNPLAISVQSSRRTNLLIELELADALIESGND